MDIKRVLIVLNELQDIQNIIDKGFDFANIFNAIVEVLYVHETPIFDIKELFIDNKFNENLVKNRIKELIESKTNEDIAIFVKIDDTQDRIWDLTREDKETLVVTSYHKDITLKIIDTCKQPLFIFKQDIKLEKIALIFENFEGIDDSLEFLKNSISKDIELIYNFNYIPNIDPADPLVSTTYVDNEILLQTQEELFTNLKKKYNLNGKMFINAVSSEDELIDYLNNSDYSLITLAKMDNDFIVSIKEEIIKNVNKNLIVLP